MAGMIVYRLTCAHGHEFEVWFRDSATCDEQIASRAVTCPLCDSRSVRKSLMAPNVAPKSPELPPEAARKVALRTALAALRRKVEADCDYVGDRFAEEARRIHYGETDAHGIYGEATDKEADALVEEGIEFGRIPWTPRLDS